MTTFAVWLLTTAALVANGHEKKLGLPSVSQKPNGVAAPAASAAGIPDSLQQVLQQGHIRINNAKRAFAKIAKMSGDGPDQLLVISDFDYTMSRAYDDKGKPCSTTHGIFEHTDCLADLAAKFNKNRLKYQTIEFAQCLNDTTKTPFMEDWWRESNEAIVQQRINRSLLEEIILNSYIRLRHNAPYLLHHLESVKVPLVMFSAGIGNIISIFLTQRLGAVPSNMHIISNTMVFDHDNFVSGFTEPLIHTFTKKGGVIKKMDEQFYYEMIKRDNFILMGDSMGDIHMDSGVEEHKKEDTLKIGFLNHRDDLLDFYMANYDVVIVDDQSMDVPRAIIDAITAGGH